jgi:UDP-N-acetylglucosamine--N-acetylmuramyl-(pentapeptide) pyrophosphoryl-undecaprenol N-acetylglucosamine transferase
MALVSKDAALMVRDWDAKEQLLPTACDLLENPEKIATLEKNIAALARTEAAMDIAKEVYTVLEK